MRFLRERRNAAALLLLVALTGCISYCKGGPVLVRAASGDLDAMEETGNLGRPRVPSTAEFLPLIRDGFDALKPGLQSPKEAVRVEAVDALRHLAVRAPDVWRNNYQDVFDAPLADSSREVRWRAAWALERLGATSAALRAAGDDPDDVVATFAFDALGKAFDDQALPVYERGLDRAEPVRKAAIHAVEKIAGHTLPDAAAARAFLNERRSRAGASNPDTAPLHS